VRPGTEAWLAAHPKTGAAIRAVWDGTETPEQRELFDRWLRYRITEGLVIGEGSRKLLADVKGRRGQKRQVKR